MKLGNFPGRELEGSQSVYGVESCKIAFVGGHFLFTCSETFTVGCIVLPQCTASPGLEKT